jgi:hypothetical protein
MKDNRFLKTLTQRILNGYDISYEDMEMIKNQGLEV